jgi:hypothetical protein
MTITDSEFSIEFPETPANGCRPTRFQFGPIFASLNCADGSRFILYPARIHGYGAKTLEDYFSLLHEMGHAYHRHREYVSHDELIRYEIQAWRYAARCLNLRRDKKVRLRFRAYAMKCIETYLIDAEKVVPKKYNRAAVFYFLTQGDQDEDDHHD